MIDKYSVKAIGDRPKVLKENTIKSIYYRDTPKIIFYSSSEPAILNQKSGYDYY
jgi:hypothetical protein